MNWLLLALSTAILWGICYSSTEQIVKHVDIKSYLTASCLLSGLGFLIWGLVDGTLIKDLSNDTSNSWWWIILSSLTSFLACYCSVSAVKYGGASLASIIEISYPLWVVVFTSIINGKNNVSQSFVIGGLLIFCGTFIVVRGQHVN